ncbi:amino acid permease [Penicillium paradoxum]|uniref:amino acid permease n=1 Tax=Penicillium paradoxum TaxID=176176 RepID=UPI0025465AEA|nr:amino acid permease [Penicillium paradoxum]KAJ5780433.1 amino acid permease [Penicillium paradoxum]
MVENGLKSEQSVTGGQSIWESDDAHIKRMGKKPVLKRNFGTFSIFGLSCTILGTWECLLGAFIRPLQNGGSGGTVYAFIFCWLGTIAIFVVLAELVSMAPTAGGQYHWAAMLAPQRYQKFLSYITGWMTVIGWQTGLASLAFLTGTTIQGAAILGNVDFESPPWQGTLLVWASLTCALIANLTGGRMLPRIETVVLFIHILGFLGIMIPLTYMSDHKSHEMFLQFLNYGEFSSQGLAWCIGMSSCAFVFAGGDAAVHMSEEVVNASRVIPRVLILGVITNGCLGFGMLLAVLFCAGDLQDALDSPTGYPFMEIFYQATRSRAGSLAMCSIIIINFSCSLIGMLAATSRQLWSFSRDRGLPGWRWWSQVSPSFKLPIHSIILTVLVSMLLALINIGSPVALDDILSMAVSSIYLSYLVISILLLYRRIKGDISEYNDSEDAIVNVPGAQLVWGPFHCSGIWGTLINAFATFYILLVVFFSFWPSKMNPGVEGMNWSILGVGGSSIIGVIYYFVRARRIYTGPIREVSVETTASVD